MLLKVVVPVHILNCLRGALDLLGDSGAMKFPKMLRMLFREMERGQI